MPAYCENFGNYKCYLTAARLPGRIEAAKLKGQCANTGLLPDLIAWGIISSHTTREGPKLFDCNHYVPILLAKRGERIALRELPAPIRAGFTPLLEIPQVPVDLTLEDYKDLDEHIKRFPDNLNRDLGEYKRFFLDVPYLIDPEELVDDQHPMSFLFAGCREHGLNAVPVASNERGGNHNVAVREIMETDGRGACLRLSKSDLRACNEVVKNMLLVLDAMPKDIDLVVDLGLIQQSDVHLYVPSLLKIFSSPLFSKRSWKSVTLASGAFPVTLGALQQGLSELPRADWELWNLVCDGLSDQGQAPTFGDYGIHSPDWEDGFDPRYMNASGNIRYATPNSWLVAKGPIVIGPDRVGFHIYRGLCDLIVGRPEYMGPDFSPGDLHIRNCANGTEGPGTPEKWRRQGTSHHIAAVVDQVSAT